VHQAQAFRRLSTWQKQAQPTLVTTGTGSGKTEAFLYPVLDHCQRQRRDGQRGVKALLLYPMNALAADQTFRLNELLMDPELSQVTAGLYIGDVAAVEHPRVMTRRSEMRTSPPDILITNYKMLDLLLQRADDLPLWEGADLAYVVLDEFHTYDGAQGTDVAMLLRRLAAVLGVGDAQRPLGRSARWRPRRRWARAGRATTAVWRSRGPGRGRPVGTAGRTAAGGADRG
jgi:ATP-dependent helicase YprA (DUF1998 family)